MVEWYWIIIGFLLGFGTVWYYYTDKEIKRYENNKRSREDYKED